MHVCVDISDLFLKQATVLTGSQTDRLEACDLKESKQMGFQKFMYNLLKCSHEMRARYHMFYLRVRICGGAISVHNRCTPELHNFREEATEVALLPKVTRMHKINRPREDFAPRLYAGV